MDALPRRCTDPTNAIQKSLWDVALGLYANLSAKLDATLVGEDRQWLKKLPALSGALGVAELVHQFGGPVHDDIQHIIQAGDAGDWVGVRASVRDTLAKAVPAPFAGIADPDKYEAEFLYLMARYAHAFIVLVHELNQSA